MAKVLKFGDGFEMSLEKEKKTFREVYSDEEYRKAVEKKAAEFRARREKQQIQEKETKKAIEAELIDNDGKSLGNIEAYEKDR